jgi:hypothetical protein
MTTSVTPAKAGVQFALGRHPGESRGPARDVWITPEDPTEPKLTRHPREGGGPAIGDAAMTTKQPCVYLLASQRNGTLYVGVTSNLVKRI